jgi:ElaB/YqjD/DUF883 family membrane-anchored ribosome-binding protein
MNAEETKENQSAEELVKATVRNVSDLASLATHRIEESLTRGKTKLDEMQAVVSEKTKQCAQSTDHYIHENPWQAIGIAAGVGLLCGLLLRRR